MKCGMLYTVQDKYTPLLTCCKPWATPLNDIPLGMNLCTEGSIVCYFIMIIALIWYFFMFLQVNQCINWNELIHTKSKLSGLNPMSENMMSRQKAADRYVLSQLTFRTYWNNGLASKSPAFLYLNIFSLKNCILKTNKLIFSSWTKL